MAERRLGGVLQYVRQAVVDSAIVGARVELDYHARVYNMRHHLHPRPFLQCHMSHAASTILIQFTLLPVKPATHHPHSPRRLQRR